MRYLFAFILLAASIGALPYTTQAANIREVGGLAAIHKLGVEKGRLCMSDHPHFGQTGTWQTLNEARTSAMKSWIGFTRLEYGSDWSDFNVAADKKVECQPVPTGRGEGWTCKIEARPCMR